MTKQITVAVERGGTVIDTIRRVPRVHKRDQLWSVAYKGKRHQVLGGGILYRIDADSPIRWTLGE